MADVRAAPYSRFNPQFKRDALAAALGALGLEYVFLGREMGGRSAEQRAVTVERLLLGAHVAPALEARGIAVTHILADGGVEPHGATMDRLLDSLKLREDLFRTRAQLIAEAVVRQAGRIGHVYEAPAVAGRDA